MAQVSYGTITITDTNDINRIYVEYCRSTSNQLSGTTVPNITVNWSESTPAWVDGQYIWQRTVVEKSGTLAKTYGTPVCLTGAQGETGGQGPQGPQGGTGAAGRSLTSTTTQYTTAATSATITQSNMGSYTWSGNVPAYNANTPAYWVRITNVYSNPSSTEYIIYKDNGITDAVKTSHDANTTAATANSTANTANQTANTANNTANNANTKADQAVTNVTNLQNKLKYYWTNEVAHTNGVNGWTKPNYPVGTYAASGINGTTFDTENSSTYGYNTWYANGIYLRYNAIKLGELTGSGLIFYNPSTTTQGTKAMELSSSALKFYASDGTTAQAEFGGTKARVSGTIEAYDGQIGNNNSNYWYIGNYTDYFQHTSAAIKSHGTAFIQLGDSNTWRLATNRIHTAWNDDNSSGDAYRLHFPIYNNKYWDSGLHLPLSTSDKFLYIRNASNTQTLENLNVDLEDSGYDYWNYQFYISADGSLYARNLYVLDDNGQAIQIGGTDGVYLLKSGGTITGDLTVNGTITGTLSGTATRVSKDLKIQLNGGTTEGTNQFTYNGSAAKTINITKSSVGLSNVENTALSTWAGSANLTTTKVGTLAAAAVKGVDTSITASSTSTNLPTSKAVADLIRGYLPLTGGNVTGAVTFGSSVSVDELTVGDLVVNGNASFTNNAQFNTINGVAVGSSPKFTDTVTTVSVTGNGNAVTSASATGGAVTLTKGTTFLTSHQTVSNKAATLAWNSLVTVATIGSTDITVKLPSNPDTNTTYTIGTGDSNGQIKVTPSSGDAYNVSVKGWTNWLPLAGGTMTGGITFNKVNNAISYTGTQATYAMIKFKDNTNDTYGNGIVIGGGGLTVIGGGESADTIAAQYSSGGDESMLIGSDGGVVVMTNVQDGYANRKTFSFGTDGTFNAPTNITINGVSVLTAHQDISGKADKSTTVTNVAYASKKITKTINGTTSDVVSASTLKTDMALNNVTNDKQIKGLSSGTTSGHLVTWGSDGYTVADSGITKGNIVKSVGSNNSGQLVLTYADDTTSNPIDVTFVATIASSATLADALNVNGTAVGSATVPVYFDSQGKPQTANTIPKLNNATTGGTFYAPTTAGTTSQVLIGGGSNPTWKNISDLAPSSATNATNATYTTYDASEASNTTKTTIANKYVKKAGDTMTGQLKTSFKSSVATGSYQSTQTTVPNLCGELRYSSGVMGSVNINTAYTKDGITVATGWYNFLWVPHRSGGLNGAASGDNCDYGSLYLSGMTLSGLYMIRYASGAISEIKNLYKPPAAVAADSAASATNATNADKATLGKQLVGFYSEYGTGYNEDRRAKSANINSDDYGGLKVFIATSQMSTGKPKTGDGHIIHLDWDNSHKWASQIAIANSTGIIEHRGQTELDTWSEWYKVYSEANKPTKSDVGLGNVDNTTDANKRVKGANITTTSNAIAYYTDTSGTFGSKASANGALYATSTNGALNWGTLPIAQGGTGATSAVNATWNLLHVADPGDLNTAKRGGSFKISNTTTNTPVASMWGATINVTDDSAGGNNGTSGSTWQIVLQSASNSMWLRCITNTGNWTDYAKFYTTANKPTKSDVGLSNVENKSSATIRGELTSSNVTTALGYTPVNKAGDTMTGVLTALGSQYTDAYGGALNMNNSNIYGVNSIYTADYSDNSQEGIHFYRDSTHVDTIHAAGGGLYFTPNRALGSNGTSYAILHTGNYTSTLNNKYVTIDTNQTITASQKTFNGATRWSVSGSATGSKYGACQYDSTLDALVFSFGTI